MRSLLGLLLPAASLPLCDVDGESMRSGRWTYCHGPFGFCEWLMTFQCVFIPICCHRATKEFWDRNTILLSQASISTAKWSKKGFEFRRFGFLIGLWTLKGNSVPSGPVISPLENRSQTSRCSEGSFCSEFMLLRVPLEQSHTQDIRLFCSSFLGT